MLPISGLPLNTYYLRVCWSNEQQYDGIREVRDYMHFTQQLYSSIFKGFPNLRKNLGLENILVHDLKFELLD